MRNTFLLSIAMMLLMAFGCFDSHDNGGQDEDRTDGGDETSDERTDDSNGKQSDGETDDSGKQSGDINIDEFLELPPEEGAEIAAEAVCTYFEECMQQMVNCYVSGVSSISGSGSPPEEIVNVHCQVRTVDMDFDECRDEVSVTVQAGLECAEITPQQEREIEACLSALINAECEEITEEQLREYEAAIARGEDSGTGNMPDECLGLDEIFDCAGPGYQIDVDSSGSACEPGDIAACTCPNGLKGTQDCLFDQTYSPCVCSGGGSFVSGSGVAGMGGGSAGVGGAVPVPPTCIEGETYPCICVDGSNGVQVCLDGYRSSACECFITNPSQ